MPAVDWGALAPFLWLCAGGLVTVLLAVAPKPLREASGWAALVAVALAGVSVRTLWFEPRVAFGGMVAADRLALAFDMVFLATGALAILLAMSALRREGVDHGEYYALVLFALAGMTMMAGSARASERNTWSIGSMTCSASRPSWFESSSRVSIEVPSTSV